MAPQIPASLYDEMDDATSAAILEIQFKDVNELIFEATSAKTGEGNDLFEWEVALKIHKEELQQSLSTIRDRKLGQSMAQAIMVERNSNNNAITAAISQERLAEADRVVALRLAGLPVPPPIQQALAGLGTPATPQIPRQAAAPPRQPPGLATIPTPPQTPQYHGAPHAQLVARDIGPKSDPASTATNQSRQQTPGHPSASIQSLSTTLKLSPSSTPWATNSKPDSHSIPTFGVPGWSLPELSSKLPAFAPATSFNPWSLTPAKKMSQMNANKSAPNPSSLAAQSVAAPSPSDLPCATGGGRNLLVNKPAAVELASEPKPFFNSKSVRITNPSPCTPAYENIHAAESSVAGKPTSNLDSSSIEHASTSSQSVPRKTSESIFVKPQKRKFDDDGDTGPHTKKVDQGEQKAVNTVTKRPREDDTNTESRAKKRVDTGAGKVIDLTGATFDSGKVAAKQAAHDEIKTCVCCADMFEPAFTCQMPCTHDYCHFCVQRVVINALVDEALYPPRCCQQPFDMDSMRRGLTPELISGFYEKKAEFETVDRTYCSNTKCSTFLYPANIVADTATCAIYFTTTCTICKSSSHKGDCPQDTATQQVLELAAAEGWKRCGHCQRMVELKTGCNHITCVCRAQWCYVCGVAWKSCPCPQWDENRLLDRANQIADRNPQVAGPPRLAHVEAIARAVYENHECDHDDWERIDGEGDCEECGDELPYFIWRCRDCEFDACSRCMYNVL